MSKLLDRHVRTFVGIELDIEAQQRASHLLADLKSLPYRIAWSLPEDLHVTLKFIGNINHHRFGELLAQVERTSQKIKPFSFQVQGVKTFTGKKGERIVWCDINDGRTTLEKTAQIVEKDLAEAGFGQEPRSFIPHVTLGRIKTTKQEGLQKALIRFRDYDCGATQVRRLAIFVSKSHNATNKAGSRYLVAASFDLN